MLFTLFSCELSDVCVCDMGAVPEQTAKATKISVKCLVCNMELSQPGAILMLASCDL